MGEVERDQGASVDSVRLAIESGDYAAALRLWREYVDELAAGRLSEATLAEAAELVEWSRPVLTRGRAETLRRLRELHVAGIYGERAAGRSALVRASF